MKLKERKAKTNKQKTDLIHGIPKKNKQKNETKTKEH